MLLWGLKYKKAQIKLRDKSPGVETYRASSLLVRVRLGDRPRICPTGGTRAQVELRRDCSAPGGVGERASPAGDDINSRGSDHTFVGPALTLKVPTDGKEHAVRPVGPDDDCGAAKIPLIILEARQRPREVPQCVALPEVSKFIWVSPPGSFVTLVIVAVAVAVNGTCVPLAVVALAFLV